MAAAPVTLLFTDLVHSTELLARPGHERVHPIFQAHHRLLERCAAPYGARR